MAISYKDAGVDVEEGNAFVKKIASVAASTHSAHVLTGLGGFSGLFEIPAGYRQPVLVSGTDGVGTKLKLCTEHNTHEVAGIDLVAMVVNDIAVCGAKPLFFLDYFASGKLESDVAARVVSGIAQACKESECSLVGGETAEMPGMYQQGDYDVAGFAVGIVEKEDIRSGDNLREGDVLIGLASSGVHSNGFSLVRKLLEVNKIKLTDAVPFSNETVAEALLKPTKLYSSPMQKLDRNEFVAAAHITGGGIVENVPRFLPGNGLSAEINTAAISVPPLFKWLQSLGVTPEQMALTFNLGTGMVIACRPDAVNSAMEKLAELTPSVIGKITNRKSEPLVWSAPCASLF